MSYIEIQLKNGQSEVLITYKWNRMPKAKKNWMTEREKRNHVRTKQNRMHKELKRNPSLRWREKRVN
jgi:hypothetical protein